MGSGHVPPIAAPPDVTERFSEVLSVAVTVHVIAVTEAHVWCCQAGARQRPGLSLSRSAASALTRRSLGPLAPRCLRARGPVRSFIHCINSTNAR